MQGRLRSARGPEPSELSRLLTSSTVRESEGLQIDRDSSNSASC
jgi:hypothetical protein